MLTLPGYSNEKSLVLLVLIFLLFFFLLKATFLFKKKMNFEWYSRRKIGDAKFHIHR